MTAFKKLFLYAFATGIETLGDSKGALKRIDDILSQDEQVLWLELQRAIEQQHRLKIFKHYEIDMEIGSEIDYTGLPNTILQELLKTPIELSALKLLVTKEIDKRNG